VCSCLQIGRSSESPIDFVVMDTIPGDKTGESKVLQSTISRFACRILCDRSNPRVAKIFAAGFDSSRNIFLGVSASSALLSDMFSVEVFPYRDK
jgi:pellino protein